MVDMGKARKIDYRLTQATRESRAGRFVLQVLQNTARVAATAKCDRWEFAIEVEHLIGHSNITELRQLRLEGHIEAAIETTAANAPRRSFQKLANLSFPSRTCLILAQDQDSSANVRGSHGAAFDAPEPSIDIARRPIPHWDRLSRTLSVGDRIVKRLRRPAASQVTILDAFEEEGWPASIYDPLSPLEGDLPKRRLHNAINKLNAGLVTPLLHFHGNGDGLSVCWEWTESGSASTGILIPRPRQHNRRQRKVK